MNNVIRFSAADRNAIRKHVVGQPTGVIVTLGGFDLDLVPLTTEQAGDVFEVLDAIAPLIGSTDSKGDVAVNKDAWAEIIAKEGKRVKAIARSVLRESAVANDLIDESDAGDEVFDEWFEALPFKVMLTTLFPKVVQAQGLTTLLGNDSTPTVSETAGDPTNP